MAGGQWLQLAGGDLVRLQEMGGNRGAVVTQRERGKNVKIVHLALV